MSLKRPLEEFENFKSEKEKPIIKWLLYGDFIFLFTTFFGLYIYQELFGKTLISWFNYWLLVAGNLLLFITISIVWKKNYKVWLIKYILIICGTLLLTTWIYLTDPKYTRSMFAPIILMISISGGFFFDTTLVIIAFLTGAIFYGLIILRYSNLGVLPPTYEIYLNYMFFSLTAIFSILMTTRIKIFLNELLEKRKEAEESRSVLEIKVKSRTKELEELTQTLDQRVKGRTQELEKSKEELQGRVNELEKFHQLTIGRELKMVELKEEIEKLKNELEKQKVDNKS